MLGDIGGFNDGLNLILSFFLIAYNIKWLSISLNLSLFKILPDSSLSHINLEKTKSKLDLKASR